MHFIGEPNVVVLQSGIDDSVQVAIVATGRSGELSACPVSFVNHLVNPPTVDCDGKSGDQTLNGEGIS